ncbi:MAG: hypothetical protein II980_05790 [Clostridia bacterium]|nr:hypothetical protein [Clostridia bacterium]
MSMSKKIALFFMIVSIFVCLLAISASAQTVIFDSYEEKTNLTYDATELVTFNDGYSYPSYYIFSDSASFTTNYEWLNGKTGKSYSDANVIELCVPTGVTTGGYFKNNSSFTSLLKLNTGKTLTATNGDFYQNKTLTHVTFGSGYTNSGLSTWFFNGAKVEYVIFDDNSAVSTLPSAFFANLNTLKGLYLGSSITNIGSGTFDKMGSSNVFLMNTPSDTEAPEIYYFKGSIVEGNFYGFKTNSATKVWVFPSTVNGIGSGWNIDGSANIPKSFVFLTSNANNVTINNAIGSSKFNTTNFYFPNISSENATNMSVVPTTTYFFGVDGKKTSYNGGFGTFTDMADSDHLRDITRDEVIDATCLENSATKTYCFCGKMLSTVYEENTALGHEHSIFLDLVYESFLKEGYHKYKCVRCDDVKHIKEEALFTCLGYSVPMDNEGGIAVGFLLNKNAIATYESATSKSLSFGVFAVLKDRLGTNDVFDKNGNAVAGAISADIFGYEFDMFELKIVGFEDDYKDIKLAMGAYVAITNGSTTEYSYLQSGTIIENEKYCFTSYNDIIKLASNEEVAQ